MEEGIQTKVTRMSENSQVKMQEAIQKIVNDGNGSVNFYYYITDCRAVWSVDGCKAVQIIKIKVNNVENRRKAGGFRQFFCVLLNER